MSKKIGKLAVVLSAETSKLSAGLNRGVSLIGGFSGSAMSSAGRLAGFLGPVAAAFGMGIGIAHLVEVGNRLNDISNAASRLNIAVESLQGLQHAAKMADVESEAFNASLGAMVKNVGLAAMGSGKAKKALDDMGISAQKLSELSTENQFKAIAEALGRTEDLGRRSANAVRIFGGEGQKLLPMFEGGAAAVQAMQTEFQKLRVGMSAVDAAQLEQAERSLKLMKTTLDGVAEQLVVQLAPIVAAIGDAFVKWSTSGTSWRDININAIGMVGSGIAKVLDVIEFFKLGWLGLKVVGMTAMSGILGAVEKVATAMRSMLEWTSKIQGKVYKALGLDDTAIGRLNTDVAGMFSDGLSAISDSAKSLRAETAAALDGASADYNKAFDAKSWGTEWEYWLDGIKRKSEIAAAAVAANQPKPTPWDPSMFDKVQTKAAGVLETAQKLRDISFGENRALEVGTAAASVAPLQAFTKGLEAKAQQEIEISRLALAELKKIQKQTLDDDEEVIIDA